MLGQLNTPRTLRETVIGAGVIVQSAPTVKVVDPANVGVVIGFVSHPGMMIPRIVDDGQRIAGGASRRVEVNRLCRYRNRELSCHGGMRIPGVDGPGAVGSALQYSRIRQTLQNPAAMRDKDMHALGARKLGHQHPGPRPGIGFPGVQQGVGDECRQSVHAPAAPLNGQMVNALELVQRSDGKGIPGVVPGFVARSPLQSPGHSKSPAIQMVNCALGTHVGDPDQRQVVEPDEDATDLCSRQRYGRLDQCDRWNGRDHVSTASRDRGVLAKVDTPVSCDRSPERLREDDRSHVTDPRALCP